MDSTWWVVGETLKARERDIAALFERAWYPPSAATAVGTCHCAGQALACC